jgi:hypothetical protein
MNAVIIFNYACVSLLLVVLHHAEWRWERFLRPLIRGLASVVTATRVVT